MKFSMQDDLRTEGEGNEIEKKRGGEIKDSTFGTPGF